MLIRLGYDIQFDDRAAGADRVAAARCIRRAATTCRGLTA